MTTNCADRHGRRLHRVLVLVAALAVGLVALTPVHAADNGSISYYYNASNRTFYLTPAGYGGSSADGGPAYDYAYVSRCGGGATPDNPAGGGGSCGAQAFTCAPRGYVGADSFAVYRRPPGGAWAFLQDECVGGTAPAAQVTLAAVVTSVTDQLRRELVAPTAHLNPERPASQFIGLPVIVWADGPTDAAVVTITTPVPFTVIAAPSYVWSFGDGSTLPVSTFTGRPYDGVDPVTNPDHYLSHAYDSVGTFTAAVTQTWDVQVFANPGSGAPQAGDLQVAAPDVVSAQQVDVIESDPVNTAP